MTSPSLRIREARERLGLWPGHVADQAGLNDNWYFDVEHFDDEVTSNISLNQLVIIARALNLTPLEILEGPGYPAPSRRLPLAEVAARASQRMAADGLSVEAYSDRVGWEMALVFARPDHIRTYTVDALKAICADIGLDWHEALPAELIEAAG